MASTTKKPAMVVGPNSTLVSQALVARIRNNEFIELAELLEDSQSYPDKSNNGRSKKRKIASILQWVMHILQY